MRLHSSAHRRQAFAHSWQCAILCVAHSSPQASQMVAQTRQIAALYSLSLDIAAAASWQMAAQSMSSAMHRAIIFTSSSLKHDAAQLLHATAQSLHASMHD
jgi:hypothetical protein